MSKKYRYLIIGAGLAGHSAAAAIRKRDAESSIAIIGEEPHRPYNRPPLTKGLLTGQIEPDKIFVEKESFYTENSIDLLVRAKAAGLDTGGRTVALEDGRTFAYEKLLLATGGSPRWPDIPGAHLPGVFTMRNLEDSLAVKAAVASAAPAAVIGGGFIGAEVTASLAESGLQVTMIFPEREIMERLLPPDLAAFITETFRRRGVRVLSGDMPAAFAGNDAVVGLTAKSGEKIDCGLAVLGIGISLNTALAAAAGIKMGERGEILTDACLKTSAQNVWAAGDIAAYIDPSLDRRVRVEHWDTAKRHGEATGAAMAGEPAPYEAPPFFFTKLFEYFLQISGHFAPDDVVRRGSPGDGSAAYFSFRDGLLEGYLNLNRPSEEQEAAKKLIQKRPRKDKIAEALADENRDLQSLL
jgi:3-phenylpropionate/trans-cinnamate dioxygenase ferredoxin reductase subunit